MASILARVRHNLRHYGTFTDDELTKKVKERVRNCRKKAAQYLSGSFVDANQKPLYTTDDADAMAGNIRNSFKHMICMLSICVLKCFLWSSSHQSVVFFKIL